MKNVVFRSERYGVEVFEGGVRRELTVYKTLIGYGGTSRIEEAPDEELRREYNGLERVCRSRTVKAYYAKCGFEGSLRAEIRLPEDCESVKILPESARGKVRFADGKMVAETDETLYFVIQINGDIYGGLCVFLDKKREIAFDKKHIIEFREGIYTAENCEYIRIDEHGNPVIDGIESDTLIYVGEGAVVNAAIELVGVKNVEIAGTGIITLLNRCIGAENEFESDINWGLFRYYAKPNILVRSGSENIKISGVTLDCEFRGIVLRNSKNIAINNVKIFASPENADGINCYNTSSLLVEDCYIQSKDDCFCMYNACDSIPTLFDEGYENAVAVCRDVEFRNCILTTNCRPFVFGGHATGDTDPRCLIENIYVHDVEIIDTPVWLNCNNERFSYYWTSVIRILSQSQQLVRNLRFENITVDVTKGYYGKIFHLHVRSDEEASYTESRGYRIENILFKNIAIRGNIENLYPSIIKCIEKENVEDEPCISDVTFDGVTLGDRLISYDDMRIEGNVSGVEIK